MTTTLTIVQICRRFGPVGGMERYVWELCRELASMGHHVHVLCEVNLSNEILSNVHIHELGEVYPKPRWLAYMRFSKHVHQWLEKHRTSEMVIHSHERTQDHHITTFHGPPFAEVRNFPWWKQLSLRIKINLWLEKRELCGKQVQIIVPNSIHISQQLTYYYPTVSKLLSKPIVPGVGHISHRPAQYIDPKGGIIGFVGKEWKRKGLVMAIDIINKLSKQRPNLHFMVAGPNKSNIQPLFKSAKFHFTLLGETNTQEFYASLDLLLHPAINEPFGMVITESMSAGVPVVISDVCGASSEVTSQHGSILSRKSNLETWAKEIHTWLNKKDLHVQYQHSWHDTTMTYLTEYKKLVIKL